RGPRSPRPLCASSATRAETRARVAAWRSAPSPLHSDRAARTDRPSAAPRTTGLLSPAAPPCRTERRDCRAAAPAPSRTVRTPRCSRSCPRTCGRRRRPWRNRRSCSRAPALPGLLVATGSRQQTAEGKRGSRLAQIASCCLLSFDRCLSLQKPIDHRGEPQLLLFRRLAACEKEVERAAAILVVGLPVAQQLLRIFRRPLDDHLRRFLRRPVRRDVAAEELRRECDALGLTLRCTCARRKAAARSRADDQRPQVRQQLRPLQT